MKKIICVLLTVILLCGCAPEASVPEDVIDTEYFTLPLLSGVHYNILPDGDRYAIELYELQDYETNGTGKLCTIKLYKEGEDYTVPGHMFYGALVTKKGDFQVVVLYPTEVTYTPANANQHQELLKAINNMMLYDLEPKKGVQWLRPQLESAPISDVAIETQYYSVNMPKAWVGKCIDYIEEFEDGTSIVSFYEKECFMTRYGGKICSIQLLPEEMDWSSVEDASLFGGLKTPDGFFIIVGIFPEEKQYSKETKETYDALRALTPDLFGTITAKEGCEVIRAGFSTDLPADSFQS